MNRLLKNLICKFPLLAGFFLTTSLFIVSCSDPAEPIESPQKENLRPAVRIDIDWLIFRGNPQLTGAIKEMGQAGLRLKLIWSVNPGKDSTDNETGFSSTPVIKDKILYLGSSGGGVYAISCKDGKPLWKFKTESSFGASAAIYGENLFIGSDSGILYALDLKTGSEKWAFKTEGRISGAANIIESTKGDIHVVFGSYDNNVYCLNADDGDKVWRFESDNFVNGTPAVVQDKVVFGGCDAKLRVLSAFDGKELFFVDSGSYIPESPVTSGNFCVAAMYSGELICIDIKTQKELWRFKDKDNKGSFTSSPAVVDNRVFIGSKNKFLYCVDLKSGQKLWEVKVPGALESVSVIIVGDKLISVSNDGVVYLIETENGKLLDKYESGETFTGSPAVSGNVIFIASEEGTVFAFQLY